MKKIVLGIVMGIMFCVILTMVKGLYGSFQRIDAIEQRMEEREAERMNNENIIKSFNNTDFRWIYEIDE